MGWNQLKEKSQVDEIANVISHKKPCLIFKHSTTCSISLIANHRIKELEEHKDLDLYYLDLLSYREISNYIAEVFSVHHESPQALIIKNGDCVYEESHLGINKSELFENLVHA